MYEFCTLKYSCTRGFRKHKKNICIGCCISFFLLSGHLVEEVVAEVDARNSLQRSGKIEAGRSNSDAGLRHWRAAVVEIFSPKKTKEMLCSRSIS